MRRRGSRSSLNLFFETLDACLVVFAQAPQLGIIMLAHLTQFTLQVGELLGIGRDGEKTGDNEAAAAGASPMAARRNTRAEQARRTGANHRALSLKSRFRDADGRRSEMPDEN